MSVVHWVSQSAVARPLRRLSVAVPGMAGASMTALGCGKGYFTIWHGTGSGPGENRRRWAEKINGILWAKALYIEPKTSTAQQQS